MKPFTLALSTSIIKLINGFQYPSFLLSFSMRSFGGPRYGTLRRLWEPTTFSTTKTSFKSSRKLGDIASSIWQSQRKNYECDPSEMYRTIIKTLFKHYLPTRSSFRKETVRHYRYSTTLSIPRVAFTCRANPLFNLDS